jgi:alpha-tubulin suppressor-like RCC1 family protein
LKNVVDVAVGFNHAIALTDKGSVTVWGEGFFATNNVPDRLSNVVGVAAGMDNCLALSSNGIITCWNRGGIARQWKGATQVAAISLSQDFFSANGMALKRDGTVLQWHRQTMASTVAGISNIVAISASPSHCLALTQDSTVLSRGSNGGGETSIPPGLTNVIAIATGFEYVGAEAATGFSLALRKDGTLVGWGQMGRYKGDIVPPGISNVVAIAAGDGFCMAITTNTAVADKFRH